MNPLSIILGGVHGKACWLIAYVLRDNLLDFNQSLKEISSTLRTAIKSFKSFPLSMTQVSSVYNKVNNNLETLHMSFIYKINKSGPRIEPWGTPHLT